MTIATCHKCGAVWDTSKDGNICPRGHKLISDKSNKNKETDKKPK